MTTRDEVTRIAREAGSEKNSCWEIWSFDAAELERFYALAFKAGMERAAGICTSQMLMSDRPRNPNDCADAIREEAKSG